MKTTSLYSHYHYAMMCTIIVPLQGLRQSLCISQESASQLLADKHILQSQQKQLLDTETRLLKDKQCALIACNLLAGCLLQLLSRVNKLRVQKDYMMVKIRQLSILEEKVNWMKSVLCDPAIDTHEATSDNLHPLLKFRKSVLAVLAVNRLLKLKSYSLKLPKLTVIEMKKSKLNLYLPFFLSSLSSSKCPLSDWFLNDLLMSTITDSTSNLLPLLESTDSIHVKDKPNEEQHKWQLPSILSAVGRSCESLIIRLNDQYGGNWIEGSYCDSLSQELGRALHNILQDIQGSPYIYYGEVYI